MWSNRYAWLFERMLWYPCFCCYCYRCCCWFAKLQVFYLQSFISFILSHLHFVLPKSNCITRMQCQTLYGTIVSALCEWNAHCEMHICKQNPARKFSSQATFEWIPNTLSTPNTLPQTHMKSISPAEFSGQMRWMHIHASPPFSHTQHFMNAHTHSHECRFTKSKLTNERALIFANKRVFVLRWLSHCSTACCDLCNAFQIQFPFVAFRQWQNDIKWHIP